MLWLKLIHVSGLCEGNPSVTGYSPHPGGFPLQRTNNAKVFPFDDVIMLPLLLRLVFPVTLRQLGIFSKFRLYLLVLLIIYKCYVLMLLYIYMPKVVIYPKYNTALWTALGLMYLTTSHHNTPQLRRSGDIKKVFYSQLNLVQIITSPLQKKSDS